MSTPSRPLSHRLRLGATVAALALVGLTACSGSDAGSSADGGAEAPALSEESAAGDRAGTVERATAVGDAAVAPAVADRKLARRADVQLSVEDVAQAASRLRGIATRADGLVTNEEVSSDPSDPTDPARPSGWGTVTISVPAERLDETVEEVARVGTVLSRSTSTDDVTAQYVDTASRVESMQASVTRVRALMADATKLSDVVQLEAELSRRQADLEAFQRQLAGLEDRVSLAPVTVQLTTDTDIADPEDPTGFLAGLAAGWGAFTTSVTLLLTVLGALLPFAAAAAVVLVPLVVWLRRRRPATATTPPAPAA